MRIITIATHHGYEIKTIEENYLIDALRRLDDEVNYWYTIISVVRE